MKYSIQTTKRFKQDVKRCKKRGCDIHILLDAVAILSEEGKLPASYSPHKLQGKYKGLWECHLLPNWLLVWKQDDKELTLLLTNTGTHSDLF